MILFPRTNNGNNGPSCLIFVLFCFGNMEISQWFVFFITPLFPFRAFYVVHCCCRLINRLYHITHAEIKTKMYKLNLL